MAGNRQANGSTSRYVRRSLQVLAPSETVNDMDLITCETTIEKLLWFFLKKEGKGYGFDVEIVGETAIFTRMEEQNRKQDTFYPEYRDRTMISQQTRWDTGENVLQSHYRIAECTLDGVKCLIRHGGQAYIPEANHTFSEENLKDQPLWEELGNPGVLKNAPILTEKPDQSALEFRFGGERTTQRMMARIFTIETSNSWNEDMEVLPRLWLSNTAAAVKFTLNPAHSAIVGDLGGKTRDWEWWNRTSIAKLADLIKMIINVAKEVPGGKC